MGGLASSPRQVNRSPRICFIVHDRNGQALSYVYYETEPGPDDATLIEPIQLAPA
jgi:hypothetical protein